MLSHVERRRKSRKQYFCHHWHKSTYTVCASCVGRVFANSWLDLQTSHVSKSDLIRTGNVYWTFEFHSERAVGTAEATLLCTSALRKFDWTSTEVLASTVLELAPPNDGGGFESNFDRVVGIRSTFCIVWLRGLRFLLSDWMLRNRKQMRSDSANKTTTTMMMPTTTGERKLG